MKAAFLPTSLALTVLAIACSSNTNLRDLQSHSEPKQAAKSSPYVREPDGEEKKPSLAVAELFEVAWRDFTNAFEKHAISLTPAINGWESTYWLPASAEAIISLGTNTLPDLSLLGKGGFFRSVLAFNCTAIIKAKNVRKEKSDYPRTGLSIITYYVEHAPLPRRKQNF